MTMDTYDWGVESFRVCKNHRKPYKLPVSSWATILVPFPISYGTLMRVLVL